MTLSTFSFYSRTLEKQVRLNLLLPDGDFDLQSCDIMYLLHGKTQTCQSWLLETNIYRYAQSLRHIVVIPEVDLSYYSNTVYGQNYWDFIAREVPALLKRWFGVDHQKVNEIAVGVSMGAHAAFKLGLSFPGRFQHVVSLSGAMDLYELWDQSPERATYMTQVFGPKETFKDSPNDLAYLVKQQKDNPTQFRQYCGLQDDFIEVNRSFEKTAQQYLTHYQVSYADGAHTWDYWEPCFLEFLDDLKEE